MSKKSFVIGIDEVGRGPLAGPVVVSAVLIPGKMNLKLQKLPKLKDSKKLSSLQREIWFKYLKNNPKISFAVARVLPKVIDRINVTQAANRAATRAFKKLLDNNKFLVSRKTKIFLDGGLFLNAKKFSSAGYFFKSRTLIKGDEKINAVKLASIVAKETRDKYMVRLHKKYPAYFFNEHKGYGTKKHKLAIKRYGPSEVHRTTFI